MIACRLRQAPDGDRAHMRVSTEPFDSPWHPPRWVPRLFALGALGLVPWIVVLVRILPSSHRAANWDIAWAGFDIALALILLSVAVAAWQRSPWLEGAATAAAALLFTDAWFDILTSSSATERWTAITEAVLLELPLALLCLQLAHSAERLLQASRQA